MTFQDQPDDMLLAVPLVLALGVSLGNTVDSIGFGVLSMASVGPIS